MFFEAQSCLKLANSVETIVLSLKVKHILRKHTLTL